MDNEGDMILVGDVPWQQVQRPNFPLIIVDKNIDYFKIIIQFHVPWHLVYLFVCYDVIAGVL